ncbi:MAG: 2Fe-2S iron-sulfur cluster-binding protein [Gammaproteobacteria bacterium]|nr:2Fe-2S iron-sulfur cluster-binding protein [Gammaproteobacteria bacterium]MDH3373334.1 2Fe-2S iron-sulfur cluster-binding protein [Gammaproteobacteria bacterium]MDH3409762.1 2Fe-2S iron-sulfur cluster-binding protein [Gammaproteobacteria bacterium]MDH3552850.1 2Fe-2S iron-sulfur cluster-binding protein [Gammaproteobacteria bacterium]
MKQFHPLTIARLDRETKDSVRIALCVPDEFADEYAFLPGQHLPFQITVDGKKLRRTYSICSAQGEMPLEIGVRVQPGGQFSEFAAKQLAVGDTLDAMPPSGQFHISLDAENAKDYIAFAAGSGITPVLSMLKSALQNEPNSRFMLFYGNRKQSTTMFIEDLYALKNLYPERLQLHFLFTQEDQEFPIMSGRLDADKVRELYAAFCTGLNPAAAFVCGPDTMIKTVTDALVELGLAPENVHAERFGVPRKGSKPKSAVATETANRATVTVIMDGHKKEFEMRRADENIVDAAADHGIDLPYSCKGGVCATCRCHLRDGEVTMATNYGLEPWEVETGFILACQSRPVSALVTLDYDKI